MLDAFHRWRVRRLHHICKFVRLPFSGQGRAFRVSLLHQGAWLLQQPVRERSLHRLLLRLLQLGQSC